MASQTRSVCTTYEMVTRASAALRGPHIKIIVGPDAIEYSLPRALLCETSTYFQRALDNIFLESHKNEVVLDDEDPKIFDTFAHWLLNGTMDGDLTFREVYDDEEHLVAVFIFGDKRGIPALRNSAIAALAEYQEGSGATSDLICEVYRALPTTSPLRDYLVHDYLASGGDLTQHTFDSIPKEFLWKVLEEREKRDGDDTRDETHPIKRICQFHDHDSEEQKETCKFNRK